MSWELYFSIVAQLLNRNNQLIPLLRSNLQKWYFNVPRYLDNVNEIAEYLQIVKSVDKSKKCHYAQFDEILKVHLGQGKTRSLPAFMPNPLVFAQGVVYHPNSFRKGVFLAKLKLILQNFFGSFLLGGLFKTRKNECIYNGFRIHKTLQRFFDAFNLLTQIGVGFDFYQQFGNADQQNGKVIQINPDIGNS